jgi:spore cortex formation protein SpoVR/YcgB (stage V sporulation)
MRLDAERKNMFPKLINLLDNNELIDVSSQGGIVNNYLHHAAGKLYVDMECILFQL